MIFYSIMKGAEMVAVDTNNLRADPLLRHKDSRDGPKCARFESLIRVRYASVNNMTKGRVYEYD